MYNNPYEEYMRNSLGYNGMPIMNMNQINMNSGNTMSEMYETEGNYMCDEKSVEDMYPEIYRIIYPMVCKACMAVNENITEDLVSRITNEVYINVENVEVTSETRNTSSQLNRNTKIENVNNKASSTSNNNSLNTRQETRQQNPLLRDLIRILVLRELIGNPTPGPRPHPPYNPPGRPPFGPGPRPPFAF